MPVKAPLLLIYLIIFARAARAEAIYWNSVPLATNLTSAGMPMAQGFSFELGVFKSSFVPSAANTAQWLANWVPAQRVNYYAPDRRFAGQFTVVNNTTPFTPGTAAYVWGFQGGVATSEWLLFRASGWTWPAPNPLDPYGLNWEAEAATAVLGTVNAAGAPFLMKSAAVSGVVSPTTTWAQWRTAELGDEELSGPNDDPDQDGTANLLEYVFGSPPLDASPPPVTSVTVVTVSGQRYQQLTIPRRSDHPATVTVEVSADLTSWSSGGASTVVVSDTPAALVVRDLTPLSPVTPRRFIRLRASVP